MNYSCTQVSQYLTCPRRYRHRYLDGWQEKDTRAAMLFGRAFEQALAAYFLRDFGYDVELLGHDEVDETQLIGLTGVVKISHVVLNGTSLLRLDGFAPAGRWEELSPANLNGSQVA